MRDRCFTLVELLVALGIGFIVAVGSMIALRGVVRSGEMIDTNIDWIHQANRLLIRDLAQAESVTVGDDFIVIKTLSTQSPTQAGYSPVCHAKYTLEPGPDSIWWIREEDQLYQRTNSKQIVLLLGPSGEAIVLELFVGDEGVLMVTPESPGETRSKEFTKGPFKAVFTQQSTLEDDSL